MIQDLLVLMIRVGYAHYDGVYSYYVLYSR
jgi:hypothetical protein